MITIFFNWRKTRCNRANAEWIDRFRDERRKRSKALIKTPPTRDSLPDAFTAITFWDRWIGPSGSAPGRLS
jgi:hypothetical protein